MPSDLRATFSQKHPSPEEMRHNTHQYFLKHVSARNLILDLLNRPSRWTYPNEVVWTSRPYFAAQSGQLQTTIHRQQFPASGTTTRFPTRPYPSQSAGCFRSSQSSTPLQSPLVELALIGRPITRSAAQGPKTKLMQSGTCFRVPCRHLTISREATANHSSDGKSSFELSRTREYSGPKKHSCRIRRLCQVFYNSHLMVSRPS